jgi:hypothetical protein
MGEQRVAWKNLEVEMLQDSQAAEANIDDGLRDRRVGICENGDCSMLIGVEGCFWMTGRVGGRVELVLQSDASSGVESDEMRVMSGETAAFSITPEFRQGSRGNLVWNASLHAMKSHNFK